MRVRKIPLGSTLLCVLLLAGGPSPGRADGQGQGSCVEGPPKEPVTCADYKGRCRVFDFARVDSDAVTLRGPATLIFHNLNRLKYDIVIGRDIDLVDGPDISQVPFIRIPKAPTKEPEAARTAASAAPTEAGLDSMRETVKELRSSLSRGGDSFSNEQVNAFEEQVEALRDQADTFEQLGLREAEPLVRATPNLNQPDKDRLEELLGALQRRLQELLLIEREVKKLETELATATESVTQLREHAEDAKAEVERAQASFKHLVDTSDSTLRNGAGSALLQQIQTVSRQIQSADRPWPDAGTVKRLKAQLTAIEMAAKKIPETLEGFPGWRGKTSNAERYQALFSRIESLRKVLDGLAQDSDGRKAFDKAKQALAERRALLESLLAPGKDPFTYVACAPCGYPVFRQRTVTLELGRTERFPAAESKSEQKKQQLASVVCPSAFSVSFGVGEANLKRQTFGVVDAKNDNGDGVVQKINATTTSDPLLSPVSLIHTRLADMESPSGRFALGFHATAGVALDLDSPDSGLALGYLGGLSVSFQDRFFVTLGYQYNKVDRLAGGFVVGDIKPMDLPAPPTETEWEAGISLSISYWPRSNQ